MREETLSTRYQIGEHKAICFLAYDRITDFRYGILIGCIANWTRNCGEEAFSEFWTRHQRV